MKRIVFYRPTLYCGGAERVIATKANYFASIGFEVYLILRKDIIEFDLDKNIQVIVLDLKRFEWLLEGLFERIFGYISYYIASFFISRKFGSIIKDIEKEKKIDAIFVHSNKAYMELSKFNHKNKIVVCHSNKSALYSSSSYKYKNEISKFFAKRIFKKENYIACVSNGIKDDLVSNFGVHPNKINVIYNPFDIDDIKRKALEKINVQVERKYICHVGRISKEKRHTDLIDIYVGSNLFNTHDLVIVGDGPDKDDIIRYIEAKGVMDKVHLIGRVENPYPYIKNASALILCSSYEGFGNVLVEACILNVPVISSNCNFGPKEIVTDEYLFRVGDIDNAQIKIETAVSLGKPTNKIPLEAFSQNNICRQYLNIIEN